VALLNVDRGVLKSDLLMQVQVSCWLRVLKRDLYIKGVALLNGNRGALEKNLLTLAQVRCWLCMFGTWLLYQRCSLAERWWRCAWEESAHTISGDVLTASVSTWRYHGGVIKSKVGRIQLYTPYMTVLLMKSLQEIPIISYIYGSG